jgi:glyoxylase-like metal-dependent hydrolase (beta-lactamase superfamily II)
MLRVKATLRAIVPTAALLVVAGPAAAQSGADLVRQSIAAQGGTDALRNYKSAIIKLDAKHWEPGQSFSSTGEARFLGDSHITLTVDPANRMTRADWDRDLKYPLTENLKYSEITAPTFGVSINDKGEQVAMSGIRLAALLREQRRASPQLLLAALDDPKSISAMPDQQIGDSSLPAVSIKSGNTTYIVLFDRATKLPAVIRTRDEDFVYGDSNYDMILSDWRDVGGGLKRPHGASFQLDGKEVQRRTYKEITVNPPIPAGTFAVNDDIKAKATPPAADAPYQWVLRRLAMGPRFFNDSDGIIVPPGGSLKLVELAPNVQHVEGGTANNLIVAMKDGLVIFDAPYGELQSRWVIDAAKAKYPGKPIKYLVMTHHHMDHSGGTRAFAAEGATVVVPQQAHAFFERMFKTQHEISPDALARNPRPTSVVDVKDAMSLKDDAITVNLYNIANPHVDGMLIAHLVEPNLLYVTDLISPRGQITRTPGTAAVGEALRKLSISGTTIAGGHGTTAKQADIGPALAAN